MLEGWKAGRLDGSNARRLEGCKAGRLEASKARRLEGCKVGRLEGWHAPIADIHHRFGALTRADRRDSLPFRRAGARRSHFGFGSVEFLVLVQFFLRAIFALLRAIFASIDLFTCRFCVFTCHFCMSNSSEPFGF